MPHQEDKKKEIQRIDIPGFGFEEFPLDTPDEEISLRVQEILAKQGIEVPQQQGAQLETPEVPSFGEILEFMLTSDIPTSAAGIGGGIAGGPLGAGVLGGGAELLQQVGQSIMGMEGAPRSPFEAAARIGGTAAGEMTTEGLGRGIGTGFNKLVGGLADKVTDQGLRAFRFFERIDPTGRTGPTPGQFTKAPLFDVFENAIKGSLTGQRIIKAQDRSIDNLIGFSRETARQFLGKRLAKGGNLVDDLVGIIDDEVRLNEGLAASIENQIVERIGDIGVTVPPLLRNNKLLNQKMAEKGLKFSPTNLSRIDAKDGLNLSELFTLRDSLIKEGTDGESLIHQLNGVVSKSLKGPEADLFSLSKFMSTFAPINKTMKREFTKVLIQGLQKVGNAQGLIEQLTPARIKAIKSVLGKDDPSFQALQTFSWQKILDLSTAQDGTTFDPDTFERLILGSGKTEMGGFGEKTAKLLFGDSAIRDAKEITNAMRVMTAKPETGIGRLVMQFGQARRIGEGMLAAGLVGSALYDGEVDLINTLKLGGAGVVIFGPLAVARMLTNPTAKRLFLTGLREQTKGNVKTATAITLRLVALNQALAGGFTRVNEELLGVSSLDPQPVTPGLTIPNIQ